MATKVPPIGRPNYRALVGMEPGDLVRAREYYIVRLISARRSNDSDTLEACIDWVVALTSEMRLRGGQEQPSPLVAL